MARHSPSWKNADSGRPLRDALGLAPGSRLQASIERQGRLELVPAKYEPEDLFHHWPSVSRSLSLEEMDQAIADAVSADSNPAADRADA